MPSRVNSALLRAAHALRLRGPLADFLRAKVLHGLVVGLLLYVWLVHMLHYFPNAPLGVWSSVALATLGAVIPVLFVLRALNQSLEKLRQVNEQLELRVKERTLELEDAYSKAQSELAERKRLEADLESAARFPQENPNPVMRLGQGRVLTFANSGAQELLAIWGCAVGDEVPAEIADSAVAALTAGVYRQVEGTYGGRTYGFGLIPFLPANHVNLYARDITDRKQAEAALRASEERFRVLSEAMPQIVWTLNAAGDMDYVNEYGQKYCGVRLEDVAGWKWASITHPDDYAAADPLGRQALASGEVLQIEQRLRRADGEYRWHLTRVVPLRDQQGKVIRWIGTATDIHDQKTAEHDLERRVAERTAELERADANLSALIESTDDLIWSVDCEYKLLTFNQAFQENIKQDCGIQAELGMAPKELLTPVRANAWPRMYERAVSEGPYQVEYVLFDGRTLELALSPIIQNNRTAGIAVFGKDITHRKQTEVELRRLNRALRILSSSNQVLVRAQDESELPQEICRILVEEGGYRLAWMGVAEQDAEKTLRPIASAGVEDGYLQSVKLTWADTERGRGPGGIAIRTRQPAVCRNTMEDPRFALWREDAIRRAYASCGAVPIIFGDKSLGVLAVYSSFPDAFDPAEMRLLAELVEDLTFGLRALRAHAERQQMAEQILKSEAMLKEAQHVAHLGHWEWDIARRALTWSDELYRLYGLKPGESEPTLEVFATFVLPEDLPLVEREAQRTLKDHEDTDFDFRIKRADGKVRVLHALAHAVRSPEGRVVAAHGTTQDVTDRVEVEAAIFRANAELHRMNRALHTLSACNEVVVRAQTELELLQETCKILVEVGGYRFAWIGYRQFDEAKSVRSIASAGVEEGYLQIARIGWADDPWGRGPTGTAIRTGKLIVNRNSAEDASVSPWREEQLKRGYACSIGLPIRAGAQILGALTLYAAEPGAFDDAEIRLLSELADDLGFGIDALRTRDDRERTAAALKESELRYKNFLAHSTEGVWRIELTKPLPVGLPQDESVKWLFQQGYMAECNLASARIFGFSAPEELVGRRLEDLFIPSDEGRIEAFRSLARDRFQNRTVGFRTRDGAGNLQYFLRSEIPIVEDGTLKRVWGLTRDVTELMRAEQALRESREEIALRNRIATIFLTSPDDQMFADVLEEVLGATQSKQGVFGYIDEDGSLVCPSMTRTWDECRVAGKSIRFPRETWAGGWGQALKSGQPVISNQPGHVPGGHVPIARAAVVPILSQGEVIGQFAVANKATDYTERDAEFLRRLAVYIAPVLRARLERNWQEAARQRAEEEARKASAEIHDLYNHAPCGYHSLDKEGGFLRMNDTELQWLGYTREEVVGKLNFANIVTEKSRQMFAESFPRFKQDGLALDLEYELVRKDGSVIPVLLNATAIRDEDGNYVMSRSTVYDITLRKRAQAAVAAERQRLYDVLETLPALICLLTPQHRVAFANRAFRLRFGEPAGRPCHKICFGHSLPCEFCESYKVLDTRKPHHWEIASPDGSVFEVYDFPFTDVDGSPMILEMEVDITDRKRAEESLRQLSAQLLRTQDDERRRIARELHDSIGQELTALDLNIGWIQQSAHDLDARTREVVVESLELIKQCSQEVRDFSYLLHPPVLDEFGLAAALRWYVGGVARRAGIHITLEVPEDLPRRSLDVETALFRVVQECLTNVLRHSGSPTVRIRIVAEADRLCLEVADQGHGLQAQVQSTSVSRPGVGLTGMRERMRELGGSLEIESGDRGTIVRAMLPLEKEEAA